MQHLLAEYPDLEPEDIQQAFILAHMREEGHVLLMLFSQTDFH